MMMTDSAHYSCTLSWSLSEAPLWGPHKLWVHFPLPPIHGLCGFLTYSQPSHSATQGSCRLAQRLVGHEKLLQLARLNLLLSQLQNPVASCLPFHSDRDARLMCEAQISYRGSLVPFNICLCVCKDEQVPKLWYIFLFWKHAHSAYHNIDSS